MQTSCMSVQRCADLRLHLRRRSNICVIEHSVKTSSAYVKIFSPGSTKTHATALIIRVQVLNAAKVGCNEHMHAMIHTWLAPFHNAYRYYREVYYIDLPVISLVINNVYTNSMDVPVKVR